MLQRYPLALLLLDRHRLRREQSPHPRQRTQLGWPCRNGIDANAARGKLERPAAGQVLKRVLAGSIVREARGWLVSECARHISYRSLRRGKIGKRRRGKQARAAAALYRRSC